MIPTRKAAVAWQHKALIVLLCALCVVQVVLFIDAYAVNMVAFDEWGFLNSYLGMPSASVFERFYDLHNEHRIFVPRLIANIVLEAANYDYRALFYFNLFLAASCGVLLYLIYRRWAESDSRSVMALIAVALMLSLWHWHRWIDPRPNAIYTVLVLCLAAFYTLTAFKVGWRTLLITALLTYLATLSYFPGNVAWIAPGVLLWFVGYRQVRYLAVWGVFSVLALAQYVVDYLAKPTLTRDSGVVDTHIIPFALAMLGSPFIGGEARRQPESAEPAILIGVVGVCALLAFSALISHSVVQGWRKCLPWLGIALWLGGNTLATGIGRQQLGDLTVALDERFTPYGSLFWVCVLALAWLLFSEPRRTVQNGAVLSALVTGSAGFVLVGAGFGYVHSSLHSTMGNWLTHYADERRQEQFCLSNFEVMPATCFYPEAIQGYIENIRHIGYLLLQRGAPLILREARTLPLAFSRTESPFEDFVREFSVQGEKHLFLHAPAAATWQMHLPAHDGQIIFECGLSLPILAEVDTDRQSDGVLFRIVITTAEGNQVEVLNRFLLPSEDLTPIAVDLSLFSGTSFAFTLETLSGETPAANNQYDLATWLNPRIVYR
ncbi:MAG: hypothetical protein DYG88_17335 [Chloroflexi bacterium CFX4]|nr:hypothetical protein [Chloroflexi bacterium CFX4]